MSEVEPDRDDARLSMSLDDIMKSSRPSKGGRGGGRSRGGGGRASRGGGRGGRPRPAPYNAAERPSRYRRSGYTDEHDTRDEPAPSEPVVRRTQLTTGGKLFVSNLGPQITTTDIEELFDKFGAMKHGYVHYDQHGTSRGSAEVVFERKSSAERAIAEYSGVALDGLPMKFEMIVAPEATVAAATAPVQESFRAPSSPPRRSYPEDDYNTERTHGGNGGAWNSRRDTRRDGGGGRRGGGGRGGGGRGRGQQRESKTAEELDAEMELYLAQGK
eukprot:m.225462 g.225462  ORF g.225462 m.225462 type:complete len:272 (+) comp19206_c0_seq8:81-896(+)